MYSILLLCSAMTISAPSPKEEPPGTPYTEEQLLALLKEKGEITWADGAYRLKVKKVDDVTLSHIVFERLKAGKVESTLKANQGRIRIDKDKKLMRLFVDEAEFVSDDTTAILRGQEYELPAPTQRKR